MDFALTDRQAHFGNKVRDFTEEHVRPKAAEYLAQSSSQPRWKVLPVLEDLKRKARAAGLWNLFMPASFGRNPVDDSYLPTNRCGGSAWRARIDIEMSRLLCLKAADMMDRAPGTRRRRTRSQW